MAAAKKKIADEKAKEDKLRYANLNPNPDTNPKAKEDDLLYEKLDSEAMAHLKERP